MVLTYSRFTTFARGKIVGKAEARVATTEIRKTVLKKDGKKGSVRGIRSLVKRAEQDPTWDGTDSRSGGRPEDLSASEERQLQKLIHDEAGLTKVNMSYMKKRLVFLRRLSKECLRQALIRMGYGWRLRRGKAAIAKKY